MNEEPKNNENNLPAWRYGRSLGDIFDRNLILLFVLGSIASTLFMGLTS